MAEEHLEGPQRQGDAMLPAMGRAYLGSNRLNVLLHFLDVLRVLQALVGSASSAFD